MGIFVFATDEMRDVGGFDPGIITFEKAKSYATALSNFLTFIDNSLGKGNSLFLFRQGIKFIQFLPSKKVSIDVVQLQDIHAWADKIYGTI